MAMTRISKYTNQVSANTSQDKIKKLAQSALACGALFIAIGAFASAANASSVATNKLESFKPLVSHHTKGEQGNSSTTLRQNEGQISLSRHSSERVKRSEGEQSDKSSVKKIRSKSPQLSNKAFGFEFYSATSYLNVDLDGDGYYSDFTLEFDADFTDGRADVYAVIYYSRNGGDWVEFYVTQDFSIYLDDADDYYSVSSVLESGFPTSDYDFLIDLYEVGVPGIVATISSDDVGDLYALPLEDDEHERSSNQANITYVASTLFGDADADGFYTDLTLEYDIDSAYSGDVVYAEVVFTNIYENWQQVVTSDNFTLGSQTEFIDLAFNSGYPAGYYDVDINLINAFTGEVIADAKQEFTSLQSLTIESSNNDNIFDTPPTGVDEVIVVVESGGGAFDWSILLLGVLLLGVSRKERSAKH